MFSLRISQGTLRKTQAERGGGRLQSSSDAHGGTKY